jgi:hypothetical protein
VQREPQAVALSAQRRGAPSWPEAHQKAPFGFAAPEQAEFPAQAVRSARGAQPALRVVAPSVQSRGALSWSEVLQKVPFGCAVPEQAVFRAWWAVHRELAARQVARQEPFARVPSAASPAGPSAPSEAARPQAASGALPEAGRAEAALPVASGAAAELRLAAKPSAVPEPAAVLQQEA